jgi:hypothetical protein
MGVQTFWRQYYLIVVSDCTWRGYKSSGACQPGSRPGEGEVGTLSIGCTTKYQSASCPLSMDNSLTLAASGLEGIYPARICLMDSSHTNAGPLLLGVMMTCKC